MKLYYFYPVDYGNEYFVVSDSLENAKQKIRDFLNVEYSYYDEKLILDIFTRVRIIEPNVVLRSELC